MSGDFEIYNELVTQNCHVLAAADRYRIQWRLQPV